MLKKLTHPFFAVMLGFTFVLVTHLPALPQDLLITDDYSLLDVPQLQARPDLVTLKTLFTPGTHIDYYPIRDLSYLADIQLWGQNFLGYRLHELGLFLCLSLTLVYLIIALGANPQVAALGTVIWMINPFHTEMLIWISARKDILALFFGSLSTLLFVRSFETPSKRTTWIALAAALGCFLCSLLSKASLTGLPALGLLYLVLYKKTYRAYLPQCLALAAALSMSAGSALMQSWLYSNLTDMRLFYPTPYRVSASASALGRMLWGWIDYRVNTVDVENWGEWLEQNRQFMPLGILCWIGLAATLVHGLIKKKWDLVILATGFFVLYLPISGLAFPHRNFYSVRYLEAPMLAVLVGGCLFFSKLQSSSQKRFLTSIAALIFLFGIVGLSLDTPNWEEPIAIREKAINYRPQSIALKSQLMAELLSFMRHKPPTQETLAYFKTVESQLFQACDQSTSFNCGQYFMMQYQRSQTKKESHELTARWLNQFVTMYKSESTVPQKVTERVVTLYGLLDDYLIGKIDLPKLKLVLEILRWTSTPFQRQSKWIATCFIDSPQSASALMSDYISQKLLLPEDVVDFARQRIHRQMILGLRPCFPKLEKAHL